LGILREWEYGIHGVPEIAADFQSLLKQEECRFQGIVINIQD